MSLLPIADQLWLVDGPNVDFFGFPYSTRMVIAKLPEGLWVWSPIALDDSLKLEVDALGELQWLVAPNKLHHLFLAEWQRAYPRAQLCGPAQLAGKRDDLSFDVILDDGPPPWAEHIDQVIFHGSVFVDEVVFFHRASRTAIFTDLVENFEQEFLASHWKRWQIRLARFAGIIGPDGRAPIDFRSSFLRRKRAREALAKVMDWNAERVIMAHGAWVDHDGAAFLERSFAWLCKR